MSGGPASISKPSPATTKAAGPRHPPSNPASSSATAVEVGVATTGRWRSLTRMVRLPLGRCTSTASSMRKAATGSGVPTAASGSGVAGPGSVSTGAGAPSVAVAGPPSDPGVAPGRVSGSVTSLNR